MKQVKLLQGPIEYRDVGDGPVVLFVHGLLVNGVLWNELTQHLSRTHRCVVPDLPLGSHRLPMTAKAEPTPTGVAHLIADFMAALDLQDVTLVGNDTGGAIAQIVAADHGERLARLVLTNCDALDVFPPKEFAHLRLLAQIPGTMLLAMKAMYYVPVLRRLRRTYGALTKCPIPQTMLRDWLRPAAHDPHIRRDAVEFIRAMHPAVTLQVADRLRRFEKPVLLLWSSDDQLFSLNLAKRLQQKLPFAKLTEVSDALTFGALDQPKILANEIANFSS